MARNELGVDELQRQTLDCRIKCVDFRLCGLEGKPRNGPRDFTFDESLTFLREQGNLLAAALSKDPKIEYEQRKAITRRMEKSFLDTLKRFRLPLVLEIGAHEGNFSKLIKRSMPKTRVVAFEAHPGVFRACASAIEQTGVEYVQACVADHEGETILKVPTRRDGREKQTMGSLLRDTEAIGSVEYSVHCVTLDGFLGRSADLPNAMWVDVEGALHAFLAGSSRTLRSCQALYIELESFSRWEGQITDVEVAARLRAHGLKPVLRDVQRRAQDVEWQYNAIFIREPMLGSRTQNSDA